MSALLSALVNRWWFFDDPVSRPHVHKRELRVCVLRIVQGWVCRSVRLSALHTFTRLNSSSGRNISQNQCLNRVEPAPARVPPAGKHPHRPLESSERRKKKPGEWTRTPWREDSDDAKVMAMEYFYPKDSDVWAGRVRLLRPPTFHPPHFTQSCNPPPARLDLARPDPLSAPVPNKAPLTW